MVESEDIEIGRSYCLRPNPHQPISSCRYPPFPTGEPAAESFDEIVASAESEIRRKLFNQPWEKHAPQVTLGWLLVEALSSRSEVGYDEIRYSSSFLGSDKDLSDLETAGVISIQLNHNKQKVIRPERPIFCKAFQIIANDSHLAASVSRFRSELFFKDRQQKILSTQGELAKLATIRVEVPFPWYKFALLSYWFSFNSCYVVAPQPIRARITYLLSKLNTLQTELQQAEAKIKEANSILLTPYSGLS
ncbi:mitochondrial escape protein 2 [Entomophthora muscae]|uniref:Mitochondrial escape protein 2 n=1 Tax=Entomophthora muscae TaxID=34485 RepID=A0ACC2TIZ7_9FUNG|nr:mitochondrial escape protein 2 [Entomophthora muscae]